MTLSSILLILLHICTLQLIVVSRPTCRLQGDLVESVHNLLRDLGGQFPVHCIEYNVNITFPIPAPPASAANPRQCRQTISLVNESLREAGLIFMTHTVPVGEGGVTWNTKKIERFQELQNRLMEEASCVSTCLSFDGSGVLSPYFSNMSAVLKQPEHAACGWMSLRRDLLRFLKSALHTHTACFTWRSAQRG
uniref:interferon beta-like n=1 Tax=Semicossyphus pulcher TaxID=241346 RepID=UPI0037E9993F